MSTHVSQYLQGNTNAFFAAMQASQNGAAHWLGQADGFFKKDREVLVSARITRDLGDGSAPQILDTLEIPTPSKYDGFTGADYRALDTEEKLDDEAMILAILMKQLCPVKDPSLTFNVTIQNDVNGAPAALDYTGIAYTDANDGKPHAKSETDRVN